MLQHFSLYDQTCRLSISKKSHRNSSRKGHWTRHATTRHRILREESQEFLEERSLDTIRDDTTQNPSRRVTGIPRGKVTGHDTWRHDTESFEKSPRNSSRKGHRTRHVTTRHRILREESQEFLEERSLDTTRHDTTQNPSRKVPGIPRGKVTGHDTTRHRILREKSQEFLEERSQDTTRHDTTQNPSRKVPGISFEKKWQESAKKVGWDFWISLILGLQLTISLRSRPEILSANPNWGSKKKVTFWKTLWFKNLFNLRYVLWKRSQGNPRDSLLRSSGSEKISIYGRFLFATPSILARF